MASKWYTFAWTFIVIVALGDLLFALFFYNSVGRWELNPLARWGSENYGPAMLASFKFVTLALPAILTWYCYYHGRQPLAQLLTLVAFAVYAILLGYYLVGITWGLVSPPPNTP